jgi:hypothetical protein
MFFFSPGHELDQFLLCICTIKTLYKWLNSVVDYVVMNGNKIGA